jgi:hypothetical protein
MGVSQNYYPELLGHIMIINTPMLFNGIYSIIKGWVDEKTRKKVIMVGYNYMDQLSQFVNKDQLPVDVGGTCSVPLTEDYGPWTEYEVVDGTEPNAVVGIRRKNDPFRRIFTWKDIAELENPVIAGSGEQGSKGAMIWSDEKLIPNR